MKNFLLSILALFAFMFTSCDTDDMHEHAEVEEAIDMKALKAEIQGMEDIYAKAQMAGDANGVVAYYADDAQSLGNDQPKMVGKAAILADIKKDMAADSTRGKVSFEVVDLYANGNLAVEVGKSISTDSDGKVSTGKYISVFEKRDGKWICIRDIYNEDAKSED